MSFPHRALKGGGHSEWDVYSMFDRQSTVKKIVKGQKFFVTGELDPENETVG
jgi:hypothetical protein